MNADTTAGTRGRQIGRQTRRLVAAGLLVLLLHGATAGTAGAATNTPKGTFIKNCQDSGGTVMEGAGPMQGTVWCTHAGTHTIVTVACAFTGPILWTCEGSTQPRSN